MRSGASEASATDESTLDAGPPLVHARFALSKAPMRFGDIPWPDDAYWTIRVASACAPSRATRREYARALADAMRDLDGFGIRPTIYFRFDGELDPDSLPSAPEDS